MSPALAIPPHAVAFAPPVEKFPLRALAIALAAHACVAVLIVGLTRPIVVADDEGASAIEIEMVVASPSADAPDIPPGPDSAASVAAPDSMENNIPATAVEQPKIEAASNDDAELQSSQPTKTPDRQMLDTQNPAPASVASTASEASAPPTIDDAPPAPVARAPVIGRSDAEARQRASWQRRLVAHLDRHKRYPAAARREAEAMVRFTIDRSGHVVSAAIVRSSGSPVFDDAALAMMRRSDPAPAPPDVVAEQGLTFTMPVVFRTRAR